MVTGAVCLANVAAMPDDRPDPRASHADRDRVGDTRAPHARVPGHLDFTHAVITSDVLRIQTDMVHGKLIIVSSPDIMIDTDGLSLTYSKLKLNSKNAPADPRLRIELAGKLLHPKLIERRP